MAFGGVFSICFRTLSRFLSSSDLGLSAIFYPVDKLKKLGINPRESTPLAQKTQYTVYARDEKGPATTGPLVANLTTAGLIGLAHPESLERFSSSLLGRALFFNPAIMHFCTITITVK
mgnify:FL=1